jgi:hypothetical protein
LGAVGTVFGAAAGFYREQGANLYFAGALVSLMYGGGLGHEFQHGLVVQGFYFVEGPVGAEHQKGGLRVAESRKAVWQGQKGT